MRGRRAFLFFWVSLVMSGLTACPATPDKKAPVCLDAGIDLDCEPAYEPTYDALYANTFLPSCAKSGVSCHASTGRQGDVSFDDPEDAYAALLHDKVRPEEPECSVLVHRILATDGKIRMPPGRSLSAGEQCAIVKWIASGAKR
jgi:hypothetical protein